MVCVSGVVCDTCVMYLRGAPVGMTWYESTAKCYGDATVCSTACRCEAS